MTHLIHKVTDNTEMKQLSKSIDLIVACDLDGGIGKNGTIPWRIPADLKWFKHVTTQENCLNAVIMGRKTWQSLPAPHRLHNRLNVVISSSSATARTGVTHMSTINKAISSINDIFQQQTLKDNLNIHLIGGEGIYKEAIENDIVDKIHLTLVHAKIENCDAHFPLQVLKYNPGWVWTNLTDGVHNGLSYTVYSIHRIRDNAANAVVSPFL